MNRAERRDETHVPVPDRRGGGNSPGIRDKTLHETNPPRVSAQAYRVRCWDIESVESRGNLSAGRKSEAGWRK